MALWQSIPFACILLPLGSAAFTSVLKNKLSRMWTLFVFITVTCLTGVLIPLMASYGTSYTYMMGHFGAPYGNELRIGLLEAVVAFAFSIVMLLSFLGGMTRTGNFMVNDRQIFNVVLLLLQAALMAQVFSNDLFTSYVFVEIMTLSACALISSRESGRAMLAATRYMMMNLLGSGLFLLGLCFLYALTGHLLMENIHESVMVLYQSGEYHLPLTVTVGLLFGGLMLKSALFPFHTWVPDSYGYSTPLAAAVLSSLVSKGYIFLLIKITWRVLGTEVVASTGVMNLVFICAVAAMIVGSLSAIRQTDIKRMTAFSSVAQIGYIYLGMSLLTPHGMMAALFHMFAHSVCKSQLFLAAGALTGESGNSRHFADLRGSGYRARVAGIAFTIGALGMVGFPFLGGFISKMNLALCGLETEGIRMPVILIALILSTCLNTMYFLRTVITLYRKPRANAESFPRHDNAHIPTLYISLIGLSILGIILGCFSGSIIEAINAGLTCFS